MNNKKIALLIVSLLSVLFLIGCAKSKGAETTMTDDKFVYQTEQFADLAIQRYQVPGWEELTPKQKELLYYLSEAALAGRDMIWDQNYKHNLKVRHSLEAVINSFNGDKESEDYKNLMVYTKRVWFSGGIHHHYSTDKIIPEFSHDFFKNALVNADKSNLPLREGQTPEQLAEELMPIMFDPTVDAKRANLDPNADIVATSANNYYEGVTQKEVEAFYDKKIDKNDPTPISHGLNSKLVKENGKIVEKTYKLGGLYTEAIEKVVYWLEKASGVAENEIQKAALDKLIEYYKTGDLKTWDEYNVLWVKDTASSVDVVNGFIEVYGDPLGYRGAFESVVSFKDMEATKRIGAISNNAQWFEDNSPISGEHKKKEVVGISAKVITVVMESGDASPSTPIGINLPNANWIRRDHGSKSVNLGNIVHATDMAAAGGGALAEFAWDENEIEIVRKYGALGGMLHTDMHEVIGHASGQINPGVGTPKQTLKNYASSIEEARADLVSLYYLIDPKLVEIGVMPSIEVGKAQYQKYLRNGLMLQLQRIKPGDQIEQAHMRNRQAISKWVYEKGAAGNVIEKKVRDGKTFFVINDYDKLRDLFGQLLKEVQRITSEGDFEAAKNFIEGYGVKVDQEIHKEVLDRYAKLNIAPYRGFINPKYTPVYEGEKIVDVKVEYPEDFTTQMLEYGKKYSFLPAK
jgi:dipeptidyl-peptidase III